MTDGGTQQIRHPARQPVRSLVNRQERIRLVTDALDELLQDERFAGSSRLPPERELASELGVSRRLLRQGLEKLEATGRIWRRRGKGTFIESTPFEHRRLMTSNEHATNPVEVMDARLELEPSLAALAAVRATPDEMRHIVWCLARSRSASDLKTFELWDGTLHRSIAEAAHNSLLLALYDTVNAARTRAFWGKLQDSAVSRCGLEAIWLQHKAFVDAIEQRDPDEAHRRMRTHIETVRKNMFDGGKGLDL